jgi:hypothetical protein
VARLIFTVVRKTPTAHRLPAFILVVERRCLIDFLGHGKDNQNKHNNLNPQKLILIAAFGKPEVG